MARLRPGVTMEKAKTGMAVLYSAVQSELHLDPQNDSLNRIGVSPGAGGFSYLRARYSEPLHVLMAIGVLVLLIACANVSNLLLVRAASRRREFAIRLALGAARIRIIRQLLTEALFLSLLAGVLGLFLAFMVDRILIHLADATTIDVTPDWKLLAFTGAISFVTAILFGVVPSSKGASVSPAHSTKLDSRSVGDSSAQRRFSHALVAFQVAVSFLLLVTAGLFIRTLQNLRSFNPGFDRTTVIQAHIDPASAGYKTDQAGRLSDRLTERVRSIPGVQSVSTSALSFGAGVMRICCVNVKGRTTTPDEEKVVRAQQIGLSYFKTMGIPFLVGRDFTLSDSTGKPDVAIINETMARHYFGNDNPVGRHFGWAPNESQNIEIIGVVKDARYDSLREKTPPMVYQSLLQHPNDPNYLEVRVTSGPGARSASTMADIRSANRFPYRISTP